MHSFITQQPTSPKETVDVALSLEKPGLALTAQIYQFQSVRLSGLNWLFKNPIRFQLLIPYVWVRDILNTLSCDCVVTCLVMVQALQKYDPLSKESHISLSHGY